MSDLQVSLLIIGVVVVGGVTAFNWFQQWRLRRRIEEAFDGKHEDVLLREHPVRAKGGRVEPQLAGVPGSGQHETGQSNAATYAGERGAVATLPPVSTFDAAIDFIVAIDAPEPISAAGLAELHTKAAAGGKRFRVVGFNMQAGEWEEAGRLSGARYAHLRLALQLVSRKGAVDLGALTAFCAAAEDCAERFSAAAAYPKIESALTAARELDAYCAEVDVAIGVNVVAGGGIKFSGTRLRAAAEAAGLKLEPEGLFHYRDAARQTLFTLDNHEPAPFLPEQIKHLSTGGVTLLLDVPRVADGVTALEIMLSTGAQLSQALGGTLVDDNRVPLTEGAVRAIEQQLKSIQSKMEARGMAPGSERALRLFS